MLNTHNEDEDKNDNTLSGWQALPQITQIIIVCAIAIVIIIILVLIVNYYTSAKHKTVTGETFDVNMVKPVEQLQSQNATNDGTADVYNSQTIKQIQIIQNKKKLFNKLLELKKTLPDLFGMEN